MAHRRAGTTARLMDLERTVEALNGALRHVQWELQRAKASCLTERLRKSLINPFSGGTFMSAACSRRARPNTRVLSDDGPRA